MKIPTTEQGAGAEPKAETTLKELLLPPKLRTLREKLRTKAKQEPGYRFYSLYGQIIQSWVLWTAWMQVRANDGAPGMDGVSIRQIDKSEESVTAFLAQIEESLRRRRYRPDPVKRVYIPKPNGKLRPLGIPTVCANCTQEQRVLGMGCDHASVPSVTRPTVPDSEDEDLFWAADGYLGGWGLRHVFGSSRMD